MKKYGITKFQIWLLKKIAKRITIQSHMHKENIITYYKIMYDAARSEFTEDNKPTLDGFLKECHQISLYREL